MGRIQAALKMWPSEGHLDLGVTLLVLWLDPDNSLECHVETPVLS